jgi:hypothetical protein
LVTVLNGLFAADAASTLFEVVPQASVTAGWRAI